MRRWMQRHGQSTAEYAVLISIVLAAAIGMQTFVKRGLQARSKKAMDTLTGVAKASGEGLDITLKTTSQYEPYYAKQSVQTQRDEDFDEEYDEGDFSKKGFISRVTRLKGGTQEEQGSDALGEDGDWK
jgi:hypothetical protein